jgi:hypothetical protein
MAQKVEKAWAPGLFGSVSAHYGAYSQPFGKEVTPYQVVPGNGFGFHLEGGLAFQNRLGMKLLIGRTSSHQLESDFEKELAAQNPGYYADYIPYSDFNQRKSIQVAFGFTYAIPVKKGWIEPEIMYGGSQIFSDNAHTRLKQVGSHEVQVRHYTPVNAAPLASTLFVGGRVCRYLTPWMGVFAHVRGTALWYNLDYFEGEQIVFLPPPETVTTLKKTALGVQAGAGIFFQVGRW